MGGGGGGGNDGDDAEEAALRAALPAAVVEKRDASAPKGAISKAELIGLLGHVLKTNRLSLSKKDQAAVADAIFKEGDKDHDGHLHLDELNAMLSVREVRTRRVSDREPAYRTPRLLTTILPRYR